MFFAYKFSMKSAQHNRTQRRICNLLKRRTEYLLVISAKTGNDFVSAAAAAPRQFALLLLPQSSHNNKFSFGKHINKLSAVETGINTFLVCSIYTFPLCGMDGGGGWGAAPGLVCWSFNSSSSFSQIGRATLSGSQQSQKGRRRLTS